MPLLPLLQTHYHASKQAITLTITLYVIVQAVMPIFIAPLADAHGRRPITLATLAVYVAASVALALNDLSGSYVGLLLLRALQALGASACASVTYGVVADVCIPAERGAMVGPAVSASNVGTVVGPVLGGFIAWRTGAAAWVFGTLAIFGFVSLVMVMVSLPETARNVVGDGGEGKRLKPVGVRMWILIGPRWGRKPERIDDELEKRDEEYVTPTVPPERPTVPTQRKVAPSLFAAVQIVLAKDTSLILWLAGCNYAAWYTLSAALPGIYASVYGWNELAIGLAYLAGAAAILLGGFLNGPLTKRYFARTAAEAGLPADAHAVEHAFPIEEARSRGLWPFWGVTHVALAALGWTVQAGAHPAVCLVLQAVTGFTQCFMFFAFNTLLLDVHPGRPSTVAAAASLVRSGLSGIGMAMLPPLLNALDYGWYFTLLAAFVGVFQGLGMLTLRRWGMTWRQKRRATEEHMQGLS